LPGGRAEYRAASPEELVNIAHVDGKLRASALQALAQLVDQNPDQSVGVLRRWLMPEEEPA
jgi:flagellar M-ring protein FliF